MKNLKAVFTATAMALALSGGAMAQAPAAPSAEKPAAVAAKPDASEADKRAKAADCSKQADAKKLHGTAREKFRAACKKA